jgi:hypothetical protein
MHVRSSRGLVFVFVALLLASCGRASGPRLPLAQGASGGQAGLPDGAALVADNSLVVGSATYRLGATAGAPLIGSLSPLAIPSADGRSYVYNSWTQGADEACSGDPSVRGNCKEPGPTTVIGRPTLRVFTPSTGRDVVVESGAVSAAWRADGAIAYFKAGTADAPGDSMRYLGQLYVRSALSASPQQWTSQAARYVAVAWAGNTLIAYREDEGERFDVLALSGPGAVRTLASDATVVAVGPDGTQLVVNHDSEGTSTVSVVNVAGGAATSSIDLSKVTDPTTESPLLWTTYGGSWDGDTVAAETAQGVALFRVDAGKIGFDRLLLAKGSDYGMGIHEPQLFHDPHSGKLELVAWAPVDAPGSGGRAAAVLTCDVNAHACNRSGTRGERHVGLARSNAHGR